MNTIIAVFLVLIILFFSIILAAIYFLKNIRRFLVYQDQIERGDAIVILGGLDATQRVKQGVKLYKKEYANKIIVSDGYCICEKSLAELMKDLAIKLGVCEKNILVEKESKHTQQNAVFTKEIIDKNNFKKIILVAADYQSGRARIIFEKVFGNEYQVINRPAPIYNDNEWQNWWKLPDARMLILLEIFKTVHYFFFGY
jgi:uncharacterized SAM-binding protein YcdF (DUF218 family)